jgi:hypothetical protein
LRIHGDRDLTDPLHHLNLAQSRLKLAQVGLKLALKSLDEVQLGLESRNRIIEPVARPAANDNRKPPSQPPLLGA